MQTWKPKEQTIIKPKGGWKDKTYYVVELAVNDNNPLHQGILHVGFLDGNGEPMNYTYIENQGECSPMSHYKHIRVVRELNTDILNEFSSPTSDGLAVSDMAQA